MVLGWIWIDSMRLLTCGSLRKECNADSFSAATYHRSLDRDLGSGMSTLHRKMYQPCGRSRVGGRPRSLTLEPEDLDFNVSGAI